MIQKAYLRQDASFITCDNNRFNGVLGIFQKLLSSRRTDSEGMDLLCHIAQFVDM